MTELVTIPGVELMAAGTWALSTGRCTFTRADIQSAIEASKCLAAYKAPIRLGHRDPRFDGEPIGRVTNLRADPSGVKLIGDLTGMPGWLAGVSASAYPRRSVEGTFNVKCPMGHKHSFVLTGLALLGVTPPGVGVLTSLPGLQQPLAASSGICAPRITAMADLTPADPEPQPGDTFIELRGGVPWIGTQT